MTESLLPAELHIFSERRELALVYKQKHTDKFQSFVDRLAGILWLNRYDSAGERCCLPSAEDSRVDVEVEPIANGPAFTVTLDLSRNFLDTIDLSQLVTVVWQRLSKSVKDSRVPEDVRAALLNCQASTSLDRFASHVTVICLTSNVLRAFPLLGDLKLENLQKLLLNHNHMSKLDTAVSLATFYPRLEELDLRHNQIAGPLRMKSMLQGMTELKV